MLSLPPDLDTLCTSLFMRCDEFDSAAALRAVFTTTDLEPFADSLPVQAGTKKAFVAAVKYFLLHTHLADGRVLLLPFLEMLVYRYPEQDALHDQLLDLHRQVSALTRPAAPPPPKPPAPTPGEPAAHSSSAQAIRRLVAEDNLEGALQRLDETGNANAILLQGRLKRLKDDFLMGTISREELATGRARIAAAILEWIR